MIIFNRSKPKQTIISEELCLSSYTSQNYRLANINKVYKREIGLHNILDKAPLLNNRKRVLVDVKVQDLTEGQYTTVNKSWHIDGKSNIEYPDENKNNHYHIITWGGAPTLFLDQALTLILRSSQNSQSSQSRYAKDTNFDILSCYKLKPFIWHTYGEYDWHRCGRADKECTRTFIRIVETNYIKEQKI